MKVEYPNLVGVFARVFPIVTLEVDGKPGKSRQVDYRGAIFEVVGIEPEFGRYDYRVFKIREREISSS